MRGGKRERSHVGFHTATAESEAGKQPSKAVNTAVFPLRFRFAGRLRAVIGPLCRNGNTPVESRWRTGILRSALKVSHNPDRNILVWRRPSSGYTPVQGQ